MQSWFDTEMNANLTRDNIRREIELARQLDEAKRGNQTARRGLRASVAAAFSTVQQFLTSYLHGEVAAAGQTAVVQSPVHGLALDSAKCAWPRGPVAVANPYGDMVVMARGQAAQPLTTRKSAIER